VIIPPPFAGAPLLFSLDPEVDYLNNGGFGAPPIAVQRAQARLRAEMEANPTRFLTRGLLDRMDAARERLSRFVGAEPELTALVANTTAGVSLVLHSLDLRRGDEVVTTDHGYGSVELAISGHGGTPVVAPVDLAAGDDEVVAAVLAACTARTRLVVIDLITSATARIFPVAKVAAAVRDACGQRVPVLVDGAHAPGSIALDVAALDADFFIGNLHKWAYAPRGTALLRVAPQWRERVRPMVVSWSQPTGFPHSVEFQGSLDYTGWLAAPVGLEVLDAFGAPRVREHNDQLAAYGQGVLAASLGERFGAAESGEGTLADALAQRALPQPGGALPMRIIPLPAWLTMDRAELQVLIAQRLRTEVAITRWRERSWLRVCAQVYNTPAQYDRLAERLPDLLATLA
jgi:isopenicillin-N epimerase